MAYLGNVPAEAYSSVVKDTFSGDNSTVDFTLVRPATTNGLRVVVNDTLQEPSVDYTCTGTTLTFTSAPATGTDNIYVVHLDAAVQTIAPPAQIDLATTFTAGITVQGNIAVTGTVDGRDVATDGTKLDGIESGATADQTASEILTAIKTVDGAGSGLDADLLDGQEGSYYAPLASPTFTGTPAAPTATSGTNTTQIATTAFVQTAVAGLVDSAPATLDTLNELAAALGDDANFSTTVTNSIATKLPLAGGTMTGNLNFGDNNKAIFGAGSDLQIYHDGSDSYIIEQATGSLGILTNGPDVVIGKTPFENMARFATDGAVTLYYNNASKLATTSTGVDVTGTVTSDGLTVDGDVSVTTSISYGGSADIDFVLGASNVGSGVNDSKALAWRWKVAGNQNGQLLNLYEIYDNGATNAERKTLSFNGGGDISFYDSTGTSQNLFWDASASRLGIGNTVPASALDVTGTITADGLTVDGAATITDSGNVVGSNTPLLIRSNNGVATTSYGWDNLTSNYDYIFNVNGALRAKISNIGDISFYDSTGTSQNLFWDASASRLGIGTTSPDKLMHLKTAVNNTAVLRIESTAIDSYPYLSLKNDAREYQLTAHGPLGDVFTIYDGTAGSHRFVIDSSGNVGIGTTSPTDKLNISSGTNQIGLDTGNQATYGTLDIGHFTNGAFIGTQAGSNAAANTLRFGTSGTERMRLDASGQLGIGTSSPSSLLDVEKSQDAETNIELTNTNVGSAAQVRTKYTTDGGLFTVGKVSDAHVYSGAAYLWNVDNTNMLFATNDTERMRLDSSGNAIVGSTSSDPVNDGIRLKPAGQVTSTINGDVALLLNRRVSDGTIAQFRKDNVVVGSIGVLSNRLSIGTGDTGLFFNDQTDQVQPFNTSTNAARDAVIDLGATDRRFKDLYLSGDAKFNSGYGSTAVAYGCRAWVNFNGTGTVAIRDSGNVSSITDNGTGTYTINFSNTFPDTNYTPVFGGSGAFGVSAYSNAWFVGVMTPSAGGAPTVKSTTQMRIGVANGLTAISDAPDIYVSIFR